MQFFIGFLFSVICVAIIFFLIPAFPRSVQSIILPVTGISLFLLSYFMYISYSIYIALIFFLLAAAALAILVGKRFEWLNTQQYMTRNVEQFQGDRYEDLSELQRLDSSEDATLFIKSAKEKEEILRAVPSFQKREIAATKDDTVMIEDLSDQWMNSRVEKLFTSTNEEEIARGEEK